MGKYEKLVLKAIGEKPISSLPDIKKWITRNCDYSTSDCSKFRYINKALRTLVKNEIKQSSFHQKINQNMLKTTIISGPAKNSIIEITFEELSDSKTKVHVSIDLKLTFAAKFLSPIFKVWYKRILLAILYKMMNNK